MDIFGIRLISKWANRCAVCFSARKRILHLVTARKARIGIVPRSRELASA